MRTVAVWRIECLQLGLLTSTVAEPAQLDLSSLSDTSISVIIHPSLGLPILKSLFPSSGAGATSGGPWGVWFQPGAESPEIAQFVEERGLENKVVFGGLCILVKGDGVLQLRKGDSGQQKAKA
jgi:hypothetical protein